MSNESNKNQTSFEGQKAARLLSPEEKQICNQLAAGDPPWSQRAQVLLAINGGASETVAGERSGLRTTQVRYWLNKYQKLGRDIFPTDMLQGIDESAILTAESTPGEAQKTVKEVNKEEKTNKVKNAKDKKNNKKKKDKKKKNKAKRGNRSKKAKKAKKGNGGKPKKKKKVNPVPVTYSLFGTDII